MICTVVDESRVKVVSSTYSQTGEICRDLSYQSLNASPGGRSRSRSLPKEERALRLRNKSCPTPNKNTSTYTNRSAKMGVVSPYTLIRTVSVFHITAAWFFLATPRKLVDQNVVFMLGESMRLVRYPVLRIICNNTFANDVRSAASHHYNGQAKRSIRLHRSHPRLPRVRRPHSRFARRPARPRILARQRACAPHNAVCCDSLLVSVQ